MPTVVQQCTDFVHGVFSWASDISGNATDWLTSAQAKGYTISQTPQVGDIAVWKAGVNGADKQFGHVAVVTAVDKAGGFTVSQSNWNGGPSTLTWSPGAASGFIQPKGADLANAASQAQKSAVGLRSLGTDKVTATDSTFNSGASKTLSLGQELSQGIPVIGAPGAFFSWIAQRGVWAKGTFVFAGVAVALFGVYLVFRKEADAAIATAAKAVP